MAAALSWLWALGESRERLLCERWPVGVSSDFMLSSSADGKAGAAAGGRLLAIPTSEDSQGEEQTVPQKSQVSHLSPEQDMGFLCSACAETLLLLQPLEPSSARVKCSLPGVL